MKSVTHATSLSQLQLYENTLRALSFTLHPTSTSLSIQHQRNVAAMEDIFDMNEVIDAIKDSMSTPPFEYQPLRADRKEIRVLTFENNDDTYSTLQCRFEHVSLLDEPQVLYNAVSYCWGKNPLPGGIVLDGKTILVPSSAPNALRTVCHPVHGRRNLPVWIDAICINQNDNEEKSHQVAVMGDVYRKASEVLIWLGDEDESTLSAFHTISELVAKIPDSGIGRAGDLQRRGYVKELH